VDVESKGIQHDTTAKCSYIFSRDFTLNATETPDPSQAELVVAATRVALEREAALSAASKYLGIGIAVHWLWIGRQFRL
jgi:hypothetical protein